MNYLVAAEDGTNYGNLVLGIAAIAFFWWRGIKYWKRRP